MALPGSGDPRPRRTSPASASARPASPTSPPTCRRSPRRPGIDPGSIKETNVGFDFTRPLIARRVDATLGAFWNYEGTDLQRRGKKPVILKMDELGVPAYDELVFVARREDLDEDGASRIRRFLQATARGHRTLEKDPATGRRRAAEGLQRPRPRPPGGGREGHAAGLLPAGRGAAVGLAGPRAVGRLRALDAGERAAQAAAGRGARADQRVPAGRGAGSRACPVWTDAPGRTPTRSAGTRPRGPSTRRRARRTRAPRRPRRAPSGARSSAARPSSRSRGRRPGSRRGGRSRAARGSRRSTARCR